MTDNMFFHALYTSIVYCVDNISAMAAGILFLMQFLVLAPKVYKQINKWRHKDG